VQEFFFLLQKGAVVAVDAERAIGINAIELDHVGGDILQKVAVVAHDDAGEGGLLQQIFEPGDSEEIEMIGGLVEQKDVGMLHQSFDDGETLLPAAG
jgi:hypothetical protein